MYIPGVSRRLTKFFLRQDFVEFVCSIVEDNILFNVIVPDNQQRLISINRRTVYSNLKFFNNRKSYFTKLKINFCVKIYKIYVI